MTGIFFICMCAFYIFWLVEGYKNVRLKKHIMILEAKERDVLSFLEKNKYTVYLDVKEIYDEIYF